MKPDWDKLMNDFKDSPTSLVADIDCTADGKALCEKHGIGGYPTIKYGEPGELKDYNGGRSYPDFKKFADDNLGPTCGPGENLALCDDSTQKKVEGYVNMPLDKLDAKIQKVQKDYEVEMPIMKKVMGYVRKQEGKTDL